MREYDVIQALIQGMPRSAKQRNRPFESDAEIVEMGGNLHAITMDEFSEAEDLFFTTDYAHLGWNLAVCTLSDLFAVGAIPKFYMHSVVLPKNPPEEFIEGITRGIAEALQTAECFLIGGDTGTDENWRYTGMAIGEVEKPISRIIPNIKQTLWITGKVGDANVSALKQNTMPRFEMRIEEAKYIRHYANTAMDTSGGVIDALWTLHTLNPDMRFEIMPEAVPFAESVLELETETGIKKEATLLGGAGEYELLFTTESIETTCPNATAIGTVYPHKKAGIFYGGKAVQAPPDPRSYGNINEYIQEIIQRAEAFYA